MPLQIDYDNLPPAPKRIAEKLRAIRERLGLTQAEIARIVGARNGAEIAAYESDEDDLLVSVLWRYSKLIDVPVENIVNDDRDLWFGHRMN
jgi:transcriptional regulator with XRE-family HTH domain